MSKIDNTVWSAIKDTNMTKCETIKQENQQSGKRQNNKRGTNMIDSNQRHPYLETGFWFGTSTYMMMSVQPPLFPKQWCNINIMN